VTDESQVIDWPTLTRDVLKTYKLELNGLHGPGHWLRVRENGLALASRTVDADAELVELFALLHDSKREDDGHDRYHGERAAEFVRALHADGRLPLSTERIEVLVEACAGHHHPQVSAHPTIGCCWDADRLELARLQYPPDSDLLSTAAARDAELQRWAWERGTGWVLDVAGAQRWALDAAELRRSP
jgi:uncharacterized protein